MSDQQPYITDESHGGCWHLLLGDSCERLAELDDNSVDLSIYSPPFSSLYTYSPSDRDLGNSSTTDEFIEHYRYVIDHMLRVTKPGRTSAVHVQQVAILKSREGYVGLQDFRGRVIQAHIDAGWIYYGEVTVDKNPQLQAVRTKAQGLMFVQLRRDSALSRPAMADYVLLFHKPGDNEVPIKTDIDNDTWIKWASPVWYDIAEMSTLNPGSGSVEADERHICLARGSRVLTKGDGYKPIEQVVPGELVLTHMGRWRPILAVECAGVRPVVTVRAQGVPGLTLTPDHKLWARDAAALKRQRERAEQALPGWLPASEASNAYVNLKLPDTEPDGRDHLHWWTVGRWLADGHIDQRDCAVLSFGSHEHDGLIPKLGRYAGNKVHDTGTAWQLQLRDPGGDLRRTLKACGMGAANKHLPPEAFTLPDDLAAALLDGYMSGDGHYRSDRRRWMGSSVSRELLLGVAMLAQRVHGAIASVYAGRPARTGTIQGRTVNMRADWVLSWDLPEGRRKRPFIRDDGAWKKVRSVEPAGEVETWNLRVAEDESFTAEGCIVKNCPLQLPLIDRAVRLWSNPGELVCSPFAGIGSEGVVSVKNHRRFIGVELKPSYWQTAVDNLRQAEYEASLPTLFDEPIVEEASA